MKTIGHIYMYTLVFLIITTSRADGDLRDNQNLNNVRHVQHITGLVITRAVPYGIPQPYQVTVEQEVPYPVKVPVGVPVDRPFEVHIPKPYTVPVIRPIPYPVHRIVPYPVQIKSNEDKPTTPVPHLSEFQHKPLDFSNHIEYDVASSLTRHVPVRPPQPSSLPHPTSFPPPTTPETNPFHFNFMDAMRFPSAKPADSIPAISFQSQRPFAGFNLGPAQFNEPQPFQTNPAEQNHQQSTVLIRRPLSFGNDPSMVATYQHQQIVEQGSQLHRPDADASELSEEQNNDLIANFAESAMFNLNNRLRRQSAARTTPTLTSTTPTPKPKKT